MAFLGEGCVFGEEAIARVKSLDTMGFGESNDAVTVKVGGKGEGGGRGGGVLGGAVDVGVEGGGANAELRGGA